MGAIAGAWRAAAWLAVIACSAVASPAWPQTPAPAAQIDEALQNITVLTRPNRVGYATFWDGNKWIQCRRLASRDLRCEAAGTLMQPSLALVLTPERLGRLAALGWIGDPSFGHHVRTFPASEATARIADLIWRTLAEAYDAKADDFELNTDWVRDSVCPPRNGPTQNLAGIVADAPAMRKTAVYACSYKATAETPQIAASAAELVAIYGTRVAAEIQRLRLNSSRRVFAAFSTGIGYVQCMPEVPPKAIYCEAQSAESWPALTAVLTPERIARLRRAGYADPGRAPNYYRSYAIDSFNDAALANELLTILFDVYGYTGTTKLEIATE
jgi:hypothetical protein